MIRIAQMADMKAVYELICELENDTVNAVAFAVSFGELLKDENHMIFLYEEDDTVLGLLHLRMEYQLHHVARMAEIMELSVHEGCRSKGIGKQLFAAAFEEAANQNCLQLEVCSNQLRTSAHRFYEREGMKNFHYKLSMKLNGETAVENVIGKA